jgi:signal-transduction protein with cAMP-binding, CBS, and nucleotidyltransferase domain
MKLNTAEITAVAQHVAMLAEITDTGTEDVVEALKEAEILSKADAYSVLEAIEEL